MSSKVVIIGSAFSGNKGAAAMLESSVQTLTERIPDVSFTLFSMYPREDTRQNPYKNLAVVDAKPIQLGIVINSLALLYLLLPPLRKFIAKKSPAIKALREADVLLDQGGITFVDGREKFLLYNVATILPAMLVGTPVFKCAQASGPFKNPINRVCAKIFLPRVHTIISRGSITDGYLRGLGLKNVVAGADYAFSLNLTDEQTANAKRAVNDSFFKSKTVIGVSPSVVLQKKAEATGKDYKGIIVSFINSLIEQGYRVALVPHSARSGEKTHNNDLPLCREIYKALADKDDVMFIDKELDSQVLRYVIGRCDYFVASRFHAMVSSLSMKVPTLVIGWSHKYKEVLEMFELDEWAFGQDKLTDEYLQQRFQDLVDNNKDVRAKLQKNLSKVKEKSAMQADLIAKIIS